MSSFRARPVLLLDVMDTLVRDPFYEDVPRAFGMELRELVKAKDPHAWPEFEVGHITEAQLFERFFADRRACDGPKLKQTLQHGYRWIDGIPQLLGDLAQVGVEMHALSNYPEWYRMIEERLRVSRWVQWTFVSCRTRIRKPSREAYLGAANTLGVSPTRCLFVDDRELNCAAARQVGMDAVKFENAPLLRAALVDRGLL